MMLYQRGLVKEYAEAVKYIDKAKERGSIRSYVYNKHVIQEAKLVIERYERIIELSRILMGEDRVEGKTMSGRFLVDDYDLDRIRSMLERQKSVYWTDDEGEEK